MTESVFGTLRRVVGQRREMTVEPYPAQQERPIDRPLFDYLFKLQGSIEKEGRMDYHKYAARLWRELVVGGEEVSNLVEDLQFRRFEGNLILGLQDIDMRQHVYGELVENLGQMIAKYGQSIRRVVVWTTGDDRASGYQPAKIARSGIITAFTKAVRSQHEDDLTKTGVIISDNKFNELAKYLESEEGLTKLVIIEDSRGNLRKVAKMVEAVNETRPGDRRIEFIPVWVTYSREGTQARAKAEKEGTTAELDAEKMAFHAIDSPKDLLDDRFGEVFQGADVLADFDGVIGDNVSMREAQARAKYNALMGAVMERAGVDPDQGNRMILDNLARLPVAA